ncbi:MAG TPA: FAD-dependent oxidoreductase, partial [Desulforhopalus sp.]|nr:FAD-dependent oxidoreductase [Desulforhopalus sp.]
MDKKYCAYICAGCGIGDALDMEALSEVVSGEMSMECKTHDCLCGKDGRAFIEADVAGGVNTLVVGACSPRVMTREFDFGNGTITVRANLREQVVWAEVKPAEGEEANSAATEFLQETASDYLRMACTRAKKTAPAEPYLLEVINKTILVMGGGLAGLTAAKEAAAAGYNVILVEKDDKLGGKALGWRKSFPTKSPWQDLEENPIGALIAEVEADSRISVKTSSEVARISGAPGDFGVSLKATGSKSEWDAPAKVTVEDAEKIEKGEMADPNTGLKKYTELNPEAVKVGAVVLATGWTPADVSQFAHLGYGSVKNVVTNAEFEKLAKAGKVPASVAFVQSPGGKDNDQDFPYCNSVTSMVALKQAQYVCEDNADGKAYVVYQHMRTPGNMELFYKSVQNNNDGIFFTKGSVTAVSEAGGKLSVAVEDTLLGEDINLDVDMVVLAAGMEPTTLHENSINLAYRQGPAFSDLGLFDGYADSHFICFPYETRRTGVYACGGVRKAETMEEAVDDATGAALKAIQCIESVDRGVSV